MDILALLESQGVQSVGLPFGKYYGQPGSLVDVEAGFPVPGVIEPAGKVAPGNLPVCKIVEATHIGSFDTLAGTYADAENFVSDNELTPSEVI
ncbi:hypothetical protein ACFQ9D_09810 [Arthrobacter koreensis]|uniref:hypothetical protein n=1 Tax=Arthrobacter koreensis TaxID=199136 RepID=UPI00363CAE9D